MKVKRFARVMALSLSLALAVPSVVPGAALTAEAAAKEVTLTKGSKKTLSVSTDKKVTWKSSKTKVATVSKKGVVKALKAGTTTITATYGSKKKTWKVTVPNIKLNLKKATIKREGDIASDESKVQLRVQGLTLEQQQEVTWRSSDTRIATVDAANNLTNATASVSPASGTKVGTVTITAKYRNIEMTCEVTVVNGGYTENPDVYPAVPYTYTQSTKRTGDDVTVNTLAMTNLGYQDVTELDKLHTGSPYTHFFYTYDLKLAGTAQADVINPYDDAAKDVKVNGAAMVMLDVDLDTDSTTLWYMPDARSEVVTWEMHKTLINQFGFVEKHIDHLVNGDNIAKFAVTVDKGAFTFSRSIMTDKPVKEIVLQKAVPSIKTDMKTRIDNGTLNAELRNILN